MTLTIVTAANATFYRTLAQFLLSVRRRGLHETARVLVYDLGLTDAQRRALETRFSFAQLLDFPFTRHPSHVAVEAETFAWKPLVIQDAAERYGGELFWFDSATLFHDDLSKPRAILKAHGVYTLEGQSNLAQRCSADVRAHLGVDPAHLHRKIRVGGVLGLDMTHPAARVLVEQWAGLARDPAAFRPATKTHNADQAVLTVLLFRLEGEGRLTLNTGEIDISSPDPERWMSSRNKVRSDRALWQDPFVRLAYRIYKAADRLNLRWRRLYDTRIMGWHRWPKEHFSTYVMRAGDRVPTLIRAPSTSYFADPFLWREKNRMWLFVEEFRYPEKRGRLVAMELDHALRPGPVMPLLDLREHASYPLLFEHAGKLYMLPETCALGALDLYQCERFPDRWRRVRRLFEGVDAVDTGLFRHDGWWWLVTCRKEPDEDGGRGLAVYRSRDLLTGVFEPLRCNDARLFADRDYGYGRGAGNIFVDETGFLRVMQKNEFYYGEAVEVRRIAGMLDGDYREEPASEGHPLAYLARLVSPHHVAMHDDTVAFDVRDRLGFISGLPWIGRRFSRVNRATKVFQGGGVQLDKAVAAAVTQLVREVRPVDGRPLSSDRQDAE